MELRPSFMAKGLEQQVVRGAGGDYFEGTTVHNCSIPIRRATSETKTFGMRW